MNTLYLSDSYVALSKSALNSEDRKVLTALYQPLIGSNAYALYLSLWLDMDELHHFKDEPTHHRIVAMTMQNIGDLRESREKLEAIGLLKTFLYKNGEGNSYVYELLNPISPDDFFSNPILNASLFSALGKKQYEITREFFKIPSYSLKEYENITKSFDEIYSLISGESNQYEAFDSFVQKATAMPELSNRHFDIELLKAELIKSRIDESILTKKLVDTILNLAYVYHLDEELMVDLIAKSFNSIGVVDHRKLKNEVRKYYRYKEEGRVPKLVSNHELESAPKDEDKIIQFFTSVTPYQLLEIKQNGKQPTPTELRMIEDLMTSLQMKPEVVNVLIDYVLSINQQKLSRAFLETIAASWVRNGIDSAKKAIEFCIDEYKGKKSTKKSSKDEVVPKHHGSVDVGTPLADADDVLKELLASLDEEE